MHRKRGRFLWLVTAIVIALAIAALVYYLKGISNMNNVSIEDKIIKDFLDNKAVFTEIAEYLERDTRDYNFEFNDPNKMEINPDVGQQLVFIVNNLKCKAIYEDLCCIIYVFDAYPVQRSIVYIKSNRQLKKFNRSVMIDNYWYYCENYPT